MDMAAITLVSGNDEYAIREKASETVARLCNGDIEKEPDLEIIHGDREGAVPATILGTLLNSLRTPPFLGDRNMIWLRNFRRFDLASGGAKSEPGKAEFDEIVKFLKDGLPDDTVLILDGPELPRTSSFFKFLQKNPNAEVIWLDKPDPKDKRNYAQARKDQILGLCAKAGKKIQSDAVRFLLETLSNDTGLVSSELEKLFCFTGDRAVVTLQDCLSVGSKTPEVLDWDFGNALVERNATKAIETLNLMASQKKTGAATTSENSLLYSAVNCFDKLIRIKRFAVTYRIPESVSPERCKTLLEELKISHPDEPFAKAHPFYVYNLLRNARAFGDQQIATIVHRLLELNRQLVSGGTSPRIALEQLVLFICGGVRT
jgi:DNA polymerase III delta subunit